MKTFEGTYGNRFFYMGYQVNAENKNEAFRIFEHYEESAEIEEQGREDWRNGPQENSDWRDDHSYTIGHVEEVERDPSIGSVPVFNGSAGANG